MYGVVRPGNFYSSTAPERNWHQESFRCKHYRYSINVKQGLFNTGTNFDAYSLTNRVLFYAPMVTRFCLPGKHQLVGVPVVRIGGHNYSIVNYKFSIGKGGIVKSGK